MSDFMNSSPYMELCLCRRCASVYYNDPTYWIERAEDFQTELEVCDITYHKEFTPDFLKQKKIKNYGEIELLQVQGTHQPIVTVEEFERVQQILEAKSTTLKNLNRGKRRTGYKGHSTAYGRLMVCQCGNKFNMRFHSRDGRTDGVDYQCYTSVNRGSVAKRLNKGISIEHSCDSPYIQGWKLEMMAEHLTSCSIRWQRSSVPLTPRWTSVVFC